VQLVGLSYGGFVALELARRMPEKIARLVIMASPGMAYTPDDQQDLLARARYSLPNNCLCQAMRKPWRA
jgi:pimeloyl-ACP methyl ester carboxylesterase